jgi:hypothetical protein
MEHSMRMAMAQGWQWRKDGDGVGMAINNGQQQWQSIVAIDNGCRQWQLKVARGQRGSSCFIAKTSVKT